MFRTCILGLALCSAPALASSHYRAEPAAAPAQAKLIVKDIVWTCNDTGCSAGKGNSRPAIVCAALARQVGPLRSFSAGSETLGNGDLDKCNARAK